MVIVPQSDADTIPVEATKTLSPQDRLTQRLERLMPERRVDKDLMKDIFSTFMEEATGDLGIPVQVLDHDGQFAQKRDGRPRDPKPFKCNSRIDTEQQALRFFRCAALETRAEHGL